MGVCACRDANSLARYNYNEWKRLSGDGVEIPPPTVYSRLIYPLQYVKYNFVPEVVRYAWYQVWIRLVAAYAPYHKKFVLEGEIPTLKARYIKSVMFRH